MRLTSSAPVVGDVGRAFDALAASGSMAHLLPDAEPAGSDDTRMVTVCIGNLTARYRLRLTATGADRQARIARFRLRGDEEHGLGDIDGVVSLSIGPDGGSASGSGTDTETDGAGTGSGSGSDAGSMLRVVADLDIRGQVARFGSGPWQAVLDRATARAGTALAGLGAEAAAATTLGIDAAAPGTTSTPTVANPADIGASPVRSPLRSPLRSPVRALLCAAAAAVAIAAVTRIRSNRRIGDGHALRHD